MDLKVHISADRRERARAAAFVGDRKSLPDPQRKRRVEIEEECGRMVVVEKYQRVGLILCEPSCYRLVTLKQWRPGRVGLLTLFERQSDGGYVGGPYPTDNSGHSPAPPAPVMSRCRRNRRRYPRVRQPSA